MGWRFGILAVVVEMGTRGRMRRTRTRENMTREDTMMKRIGKVSMIDGNVHGLTN
jgi:hypothetical protein